MKIREKMNTPDYVLDIRGGKYLIETAVNKVLKDNNVKSFPVDAWSIARNFNFEVLEGTFKKNNTLGVMVDAFDVPKLLEPYGCKRAIVLNREEPRKMQSFAIAHEIGHFVYDSNEESNYFDVYCGSRIEKELNAMDSEKKKREDRADKFATMLLMPENMFREYVVSSSNRNNKEKLRREMSFCMVSEDVVEKRFKELNITFVV